MTRPAARATGAPPVLFHVVLNEPEIPQNTGNIGRTCVATGCALHLVGALGFDTSAKACRRAGLDYWARLAPARHESWQAYLAAAHPSRLWLLSTRGGRPVHDVALRPGDHLVFGRESAGLPADLLAAHRRRVLTLPMLPGERSLNLATAVCAVVYLGIDQLLRRGDLRLTAGARLSPRPARAGRVRAPDRPCTLGP